MKNWVFDLAYGGTFCPSWQAREIRPSPTVMTLLWLNTILAILCHQLFIFTFTFLATLVALHLAPVSD